MLSISVCKDMQKKIKIGLLKKSHILTCQAMLRKVEDSFTFCATCKPTFLQHCKYFSWSPHNVRRNVPGNGPSNGKVSPACARLHATECLGLPRLPFASFGNFLVSNLFLFMKTRAGNARGEQLS